MNLPTKYEVALFDRNGNVVRVLGFTARRTKAAMIGFIRRETAVCDAIEGMLTEEELDQNWHYSRFDCRILFANTRIGVGLTQSTKFQRTNEKVLA